jgi:hypothetical protein
LTVADSAVRSFQRLGFDQRLAGAGALLLLVSTFGPFSFVEAAQALVALAVLMLLRARAHGKDFHLPFGDGAVMFAAGAWAGVLILIRLFDRPLGQNLLALLCAAILLFAGLREHVRGEPGDEERRPPSEPPDDLMRRPKPGEAPDRVATVRLPPDPDGEPTDQMTLGEPPDTARTEPLAPPEFRPRGRDDEPDGG